MPTSAHPMTRFGQPHRISLSNKETEFMMLSLTKVSVGTRLLEWGRALENEIENE